jgi:NADP-dependent 3-hydroxy acid dehydrogenase YdfG
VLRRAPTGGIAPVLCKLTAMPEPRVAIVTGASSGIGAATARALTREGFHVVLGARRKERLEELAAELGGTAIQVDVTDDVSVEQFAAQIPKAHVLVNNAGGAVGRDLVGTADIEAWRWMFDVNVLGAVRVTRALLPKLEASGDGHVVIMGSVAGFEVYPGGGGYVGAKHAERAVAKTLRLELLGRPVRVTEIVPGLVGGTEFSLVRFGGDRAKADAVYEGLTPLLPEDVAECVAFAVTRPGHVNIDEIVLRPLDQATTRDFFRHGKVER